MKQKLLIVGSGGLACEFYHFFQNQYDIVGFLSKDRDETTNLNLPKPTFVDESVSVETVKTANCVIAIANPQIKERLFLNLKRRGFQFPNVIHPHSPSFNADVANSQGVVVLPNSVFSNNIKLNNHVYINYMVGIGHGVIINNFVQINPGVQIGGEAKIGAFTLIGSSATITNNISVGENSTIGSGSCVLASVKKSVTVLGNPAKTVLTK